MKRRSSWVRVLCVTALALGGAACSSSDSKPAPTTAPNGDTSACGPVGDKIVSTAAPAGAPDGTKAYSGMSQKHVEGCVAYLQIPPVGGNHKQVWQSCDAYSKPVPTESAVHSIEHGAVWIAYSPGLSAADIAKLAAFADNEFVLVSPWRSSLPTAISVQAWGLQLQLASANDPRLKAFVEAFANGPQNPEKGAPCKGGATTVE